MSRITVWLLLTDQTPKAAFEDEGDALTVAADLNATNPELNAEVRPLVAYVSGERSVHYATRWRYDLPVYPGSPPEEGEFTADGFDLVDSDGPVTLQVPILTEMRHQPQRHYRVSTYSVSQQEAAEVAQRHANRMLVYLAEGLDPQLGEFGFMRRLDAE